MGLFDLFKNKKKAYVCANCKKEVTEDDTKQIGNHRSCKRCVLLPNDEVRKNQLQKEAEEAGYQAYMDYARGSLTPEEAYTNRGFVKDKDGKWIYKKLLEKDDTPHNSL